MSAARPVRPGEPVPAPFAVVNAVVWAGAGTGVAGSALGVDAAGRVSAVGGRSEVESSLPAGAPRVDAAGRWLVPGFVDAHVHVRASAARSAYRDVSRCRSIGELLAEVAAGCRAGAGWRSFWGLQPEHLAERRPPRRSELDAASGGVPVRIRHRSLHAWSVNTAALAALGVAGRDGGAGPEVERDPTGAPTGQIVDHTGWFRRAAGRLTGEADFARALAGWSAELRRHGVLGMADATCTNGGAELAALARWRADGLVRQRVTALAAPSAALAAPPVPVTGHKLMPGSAQELAETLPASWRRGFDVAVHCTEVETLAAVIGTAEAVPPRHRRGLRIEHAAVCPPEWLDRLARLGAVVVTHPSFVSAHGDRHLAEEVAPGGDGLYRLASWLRAGVRLAVGSDAPAGPVEPVRAFHAARSRVTAAGRTIGPDEALSWSQALSALTTWAADHSGLGRAGYGRLAPGGPGAAVLLDGDPRAGAELAVSGVVDGGELAPIA